MNFIETYILREEPQIQCGFISCGIYSGRNSNETVFPLLVTILLLLHNHLSPSSEMSHSPDSVFKLMVSSVTQHLSGNRVGNAMLTFQYYTSRAFLITGLAKKNWEKSCTALSQDCLCSTRDTNQVPYAYKPYNLRCKYITD
jgi:hypothetical protein